MSRCQIHCESEKAMERCGCVDVFMNTQLNNASEFYFFFMFYLWVSHIIWVCRICGRDIQFYKEVWNCEQRILCSNIRITFMNIYWLSLCNVATAEFCSVKKRCLCLWELGEFFVLLVRLSTIVTYLQFCRILASSKIYLIQYFRKSREGRMYVSCLV